MVDWIDWEFVILSESTIVIFMNSIIKLVNIFVDSNIILRLCLAFTIIQGSQPAFLITVIIISKEALVVLTLEELNCRDAWFSNTLKYAVFPCQ